MKMRAVIIGPRKFPLSDLKKDLSKNDLIIAVDGGVDRSLQSGLRPHFSIGDWDSIKNKKKLQRLNHCTLLKEKNQSDFYYALVLASLLKVSEIICYGFTEGRPDHQMAVLYDLSLLSKSYSKKINSIQLVGYDAHYYFLSSRMKSLDLFLKKNQTVSVFPVSGVAYGVTLRGFQYPLTDSQLTSSSQGLSNVVVQKRCKIKIRKGQLVVIIPRL